MAPVRTSDPIEELYRQASRKLAMLGLVKAFTMARLHRVIERNRGHPVHLIAKDLPILAPHGLWVAGQHADYVFYDRAAGPIRQHQIIGNEFGHMLLDDESVPAHPDELAELARPCLLYTSDAADE